MNLHIYIYINFYLCEPMAPFLSKNWRCSSFIFLYLSPIALLPSNTFLCTGVAKVFNDLRKLPGMAEAQKYLEQSNMWVVNPLFRTNRHVKESSYRCPLFFLISPHHLYLSFLLPLTLFPFQTHSSPLFSVFFLHFFPIYLVYKPNLTLAPIGIYSELRDELNRIRQTSSSSEYYSHQVIVEEVTERSVVVETRTSHSEEDLSSARAEAQKLIADLQRQWQLEREHLVRQLEDLTQRESSLRAELEMLRDHSKNSSAGDASAQLSVLRLELMTTNDQNTKLEWELQIYKQHHVLSVEDESALRSKLEVVTQAKDVLQDELDRLKKKSLSSDETEIHLQSTIQELQEANRKYDALRSNYEGLRQENDTLKHHFAVVSDERDRLGLDHQKMVKTMVLSVIWAYVSWLWRNLPSCAILYKSHHCIDPFSTGLYQLLKLLKLPLSSFCFSRIRGLILWPIFYPYIAFGRRDPHRIRDPVLA